MNKVIPVVKPYLPAEKKYNSYISKIFESQWITNSGPLHDEFEARLAKTLNVRSVILVSNCTLGLQLSYKALNLSGNVITTPFSFAATSSSLAWEGIQPNFSDIDRNDWNIDFREIEKNINDQTSGILGVHVYGNPCNVNEINKLATKHNLKVVYDAAHAFGIKLNGESLLNHGDISILSFHATKALHSIEGGGIIVNDPKVEEKIRSMINFGITEKGGISEIGINAKMNEFQAAMGLCLLDDFKKIIKKRKNIHNLYKDILCDRLFYQKWNKDSSNNYSYFPVLFSSEDDLIASLKELNKKNIFPRRYFHPCLDSLPIYKDALNVGNSKIAEDISSRVLCLPIYPDLDTKDVEKICNILLKSIP